MEREVLWPTAFIIQSSGQGSVMGGHASAPHSRVRLPDCWWLLRQPVLTSDMPGMLSQRRACMRVGTVEKKTVSLPLSFGDSFHRRESVQVLSAGPSGGNREGGEEQEGLPGGRCSVLGGAQVQPLC